MSPTQRAADSRQRRVLNRIRPSRSDCAVSSDGYETKRQPEMEKGLRSMLVSITLQCEQLRMLLFLQPVTTHTKMTTRHNFSAHAALIPLLHAARYPHETVIGCLLGPTPTSSDNTAREVQYEHAVPLLHHWTGLSAAMEMALTLVRVTLVAVTFLPDAFSTGRYRKLIIIS